MLRIVICPKEFQLPFISGKTVQFSVATYNGVCKKLGKVYICVVQKSRKGEYEKEDI